VTAISKTRITLDEARTLVERVKSQAACTEDHVPWRMLGYKHPGTERLIEQFGYQGFRWAQVAFQLDMARHCTQVPTKILEESGQMRHPDISDRLSIATRFRVGACSELTTLAFFQHAGLCIVVTGPRPTATAGGLVYYQHKEQVEMAHRFVLGNVTEDQLCKGDGLEKIETLAEAIVIDPYFGIVCPASRIKTEGAALCDYWKAYGQELVVDRTICPARLFSSAHQTAHLESEAIYKMAEPRSEKFYSSPAAVRYRAILSKALATSFQPQFDQALAVLVPATRWIVKLKDDGNYDLTTRDKVQETSARLTQLGIQHTLIAGIAISLRNPDPEILTVKALSEDQMVAWTGLQAPQARLILKLMA
jgi:hypothetical protein